MMAVLPFDLPVVLGTALPPADPGTVDFNVTVGSPRLASDVTAGAPRLTWVVGAPTING